MQLTTCNVKKMYHEDRWCIYMTQHAHSHLRSYMGTTQGHGPVFQLQNTNNVYSPYNLDQSPSYLIWPVQVAASMGYLATMWAVTLGPGSACDLHTRRMFAVCVNFSSVPKSLLVFLLKKSRPVFLSQKILH